MLDQPVPNPTPNPVPAPQPVANPVAPVQGKRNNTIWWILGGCGCLALFGIPIILILTVLIAINPAKRISDAQATANRANVLQASIAVNNCLTSEKSKGTEDLKAYSDQGCASKEFLLTNNYATVAVTTKVNILANSQKTKVCVYAESTSEESSNPNTASWDSSVRIVSEAGKGKTTCE